MQKERAFVEPWNTVFLWIVLISFSYLHRSNRSEREDATKSNALQSLCDRVVVVALAVTLSLAQENQGIAHKDTRLVSRGDVFCFACVTGLDAIILKRRVFKLKDGKVQKHLYVLCDTFGALVYDPAVCRGMVDIHLNMILFLIDNKKDVKGSDACGLLLQNFNCFNSEVSRWSVDVPKGKSPPKKLGDSSRDPLKVLHVTDIHYDPLYEAGSLASCRRPMCCNRDSGKVKSVADAAGFWTDYRECDVPARLITETFKHIRKNNKLDYIYFTGDIISHRIWETSVEGNKRDIKFIMSEFKKQFGDIPVYPILGNHEPHPLNLFAPDGLKNTEFSTQWLFDYSAEMWSNWLPENTKETIRRGGFYTVLVRPGFRIVALNSNVAYTLNAWLLYDDVDMYGQLEWFAKTLEKAEEAGESVHVLSHIPSGDEYTYSPWGREFTRIVLRFSNTITGMFNGHTHFDELNIYHDGKDATNVAFNGGSLTPFSDVNPNYKIFDIDSINFDILDYHTWIFNVTEANRKQTPPEWYKLYSFKKEYGVKDMSGKEVFDLIKRMVNSSTLRQTYFENKVRVGDAALAKGCDEDCHKNNICNMLTAEYSNRTLCNKLTKNIY